jgi:SAM-dependent methyltransferase
MEARRVTKKLKDALPDYVARNRLAWDELAAEYEAPGRRSWESAEPRWGIWGVPESALHVLPDVDGRDVIELGCGTAYVSAWLARRGARVVGIDNSSAQLTTARRFQDEFDLSFPLLMAAAEAVPVKDASFDLAISEYGAAIWSDPYLWIPEAARLLRPGGRLIFLRNGTLAILCFPDAAEEPAGEHLLRPYFGLHRVEWQGARSVEFHLGHGDLIRLLRRQGLDLEDLIEIQAPADGRTRDPSVPLDWARRWPAEEIWIARKQG